MNDLKLKVIGISEYHGTNKRGEEYSLYTLEVDYNGGKCKIKTFESGVKLGDYVEVGVGVRKTVYGPELAAVVKSVIPADKEE